MNSNKKKIVLAVFVIVLAGFGAYANSLTGQFLWDDVGLIRENVYIRGDLPLSKLFGESIRAGSGQEGGDFYRPIQMLSYMWDYSLWNQDVRGYHLTSVFFHVLTALGIFWLLYLFYSDILLSFAAGVLFVVCPVHTEAVAYISGRADPLMAAFLLLSFIMYVQCLRNSKAIYAIIMVLSYACALLSKEYSLILPFLILLYHYSFGKPSNTRPLWGILITACIYLIIRAKIVGLGGSEPLSYVPSLLERIPGIFVAMMEYFRLMLVPYPLHMEYAGWLFKPLYYKAVIGFVLTCSVIVFAAKKRVSNKILFFSVAWYFIALLPNSNIFLLNAFMAEHWLYVPSIGFFIILGKVISSLHESSKYKISSVVLLAGLAAAYLALTFYQNRTWRSPQALYEHTLRYAPDSARVTSNLAIIYFKQGRSDEAIELFKKAIALEPQYLNAYNNLGNAYRALGRYGEAIRLYSIVLKMNPKDAGVYNNLGNVHFDIGKNDEAIEFYKQAIELNPYSDTAINNLGLVYNAGGRVEEARKMFDMAIRINPNYAEPYYSLALIYMNEGNFQKSLEYCDRAAVLGYSQPGLLEALEPHRK